MAPAVERREHIGRGLPDRSKSPVKTRHSPKGRSPSRRERSPNRRWSPVRMRSPKKASSSHKKSTLEETVPERIRSPKHVRGRSSVRASSSPSPSPRSKRLRRAQAEREPEKVISEERTKDSREERGKGRERESREKERTNYSRSPSPRSKRLMRAQVEKQAEKSKEREHGRITSREERDKGRHGERGEAKEEHGRNTSRDERGRGRHGESKDTLSERRTTRDKSDGGLSQSSRHDRSVSPERHGRSVSLEERNHSSKHGSRSPSRGSKAGAREEASKSRSTEQLRDGDLDSVAKMKAAEESLEAMEKDKQKPSFELSGKLAEETNRVRGVTLLFNEPPDARKPNTRWRLYVFKAGEVLNEPLYVHRQSCYLFGRERRVADIPTDHPSCSKQHAVIQYRQVEKEQPDGLMSKQSRICDLARELGRVNFHRSIYKFQGQHIRHPVAVFSGHHIVKLLHSSCRRLLFGPSNFVLVVKSKYSLRALPCIFAHLVLITLVHKNELKERLVFCMIFFKKKKNQGLGTIFAV